MSVTVTDWLVGEARTALARTEGTSLADSAAVAVGFDRLRTLLAVLVQSADHEAEIAATLGRTS